MYTPKQVGRALERAREDSGLGGQDEVAKRLGLKAKSQISEWETGSRVLRLPSLLRLLELYGLSLADFDRLLRRESDENDDDDGETLRTLTARVDQMEDALARLEGGRKAGRRLRV